MDEFRRGWYGISVVPPLTSIGFAVSCLALATTARWGLAQVRPAVTAALTSSSPPGFFRGPGQLREFGAYQLRPVPVCAGHRNDRSRTLPRPTDYLTCVLRPFAVYFTCADADGR